MESPVCYIGIDISKARLDVHIRPLAQAMSFPNTPEGNQTLVHSLSALKVERIVLEASGGYEKSVVSCLSAAELPVVKVNPRQVRDFAKAVGKLAKTDAIDAAMIAWYAQSIEPPLRELANAQEQRLADLVSYRRHLVKSLTMHRNLAKTVVQESVKRSLKTVIALLNKQMTEIAKQIAQLIAQTPHWKAQSEILESAPAVGKVVSATLLADLPELGKLKSKAIAALAGLAPFNQDSGKSRGKRCIWGGRAEVRQSLYMGVVAAICSPKGSALKSFYLRLVERGKSKKVAIIATMRKLLTILNSMLKNGQKWNYFLSAQ